MNNSTDTADAIADAVWRALEAGWTPDQVRDEVEMAIEDARHNL